MTENAQSAAPLERLVRLLSFLEFFWKLVSIRLASLADIGIINPPDTNNHKQRDTKMTKTTINNEITCVMGLTSSIISVVLNHRTNIITVHYANEVERVDPLEDFQWWDFLAAKYFS